MGFGGKHNLRPPRPPACSGNGGCVSSGFIQKSRRNKPMRSFLVFCLFFVLFVWMLPPNDTSYPAVYFPDVTMPNNTDPSHLTLVVTYESPFTKTTEGVSDYISSVLNEAWCEAASTLRVRVVVAFGFAPTWKERKLGCTTLLPSSRNATHHLAQTTCLTPLQCGSKTETKRQNPIHDETIPDGAVWRVSLSNASLASTCVRELRFTVQSGNSHASLVDAALDAASVQRTPPTRYFAALAGEHFWPLQSGLLDALQRPIPADGGRAPNATRVLAVQCTLVTSPPHHSNRRPSLAKVAVLDKGVFFGFSVLQRMLLPYVLRRHAALPATDDRVAWDELVDAVSPFCGVFHRDAVEAAGGFDRTRATRRAVFAPTFGDAALLARRASAAPDVVGWDLSLEMQFLFPSWQLWSAGGAEAMVRLREAPSGNPSASDLGKRWAEVRGSLRRAVFAAADDWGAKWADTMERLHSRRFAVPWRQRARRQGDLFRHALPNRTNVLIRLPPIIFYARDYSCYCCGLMRETVGYLRPLTERYPIVLTSAAKGFCIDPDGSAALAALDMTNPTGAEELFMDTVTRYTVWRRAYNRRRKVAFLHVRGERYPRVRRHLPLRVDYVIGRSVSETSRITPSWVRGMNAAANEVWVTADFFRRVYARSGVAQEKLHILPEALHVHQFNPKTCQPLPLPMPFRHTYSNLPELREPASLRRRFRFLAVMKWERRKAWDVLLAAYWKAFGPHSPLHHEVSLYLKVKWFARYSGGASDTSIESLLTEWARNETDMKGFRTMRDFPHIVIPNGGRYIGESDIRRLYCTVDAFVLPTRGEGWGLPLAEAMSMGLPVITTYWGGSTAFAQREVAFLTTPDGLDEVPSGAEYATVDGNKWAMPSVEETAKWMRYVVENRDHARRVGKRARKWMYEKFSEEAVADLMDQRFGEIDLTLQ